MSSLKEVKILQTIEKQENLKENIKTSFYFFLKRKIYKSKDGILDKTQNFTIPLVGQFLKLSNLYQDDTFSLKEIIKVA